MLISTLRKIQRGVALCAPPVAVLAFLYGALSSSSGFRAAGGTAFLLVCVGTLAVTLYRRSMRLDSVWVNARAPAEIDEDPGRRVDFADSVDIGYVAAALFFLSVLLAEVAL
jgi:hypothetical protein